MSNGFGDRITDLLLSNIQVETQNYLQYAAKNVCLKKYIKKR